MRVNFPVNVEQKLLRNIKKAFDKIDIVKAARFFLAKRADPALSKNKVALVFSGDKPHHFENLAFFENKVLRLKKRTVTQR